MSTYGKAARTRREVAPDRRPDYPTEQSAYPTEQAVEAPLERGVDQSYDWDSVDWSTAQSWEARSRLVVTPIAAPSILGLFGFATATGMVASVLAGWWGDANSFLTIFPFALTAGGLAQLLAGMWAYKARDGLATAVHGIWGSFWLAFGFLYGLIAAGILPNTALGAANPAFGIWFVFLAVITGAAAFAALTENIALFSVLSTLAVGSGFFAASLFGGLGTAGHIAGYLFAFSALAAIYTASALMLANSSGRTILPIGEYSKAGNIPGKVPMYPIEYGQGMPGAKVGQ